MKIIVGIIHINDDDIVTNNYEITPEIEIVLHALLGEPKNGLVVSREEMEEMAVHARNLLNDKNTVLFGD